MNRLLVPATEYQAHHHQERARIARTLAGTAARSARSALLNPPAGEAGRPADCVRVISPASLAASLPPARRVRRPRRYGSHLPPLALLILLGLGLSLVAAGSVRAVTRPGGPDSRTPEAGASSVQSTAGGGCATSAWAPLGGWRITAYCPGACCCGKWADPSTVLRAGGRVFADGTPVEGQALKAVAAPEEIPLGTILYLEGVGPVTVRDRGGAITGQRIDLFHATHDDALRWGVQERRVWILERSP